MGIATGVYFASKPNLLLVPNPGYLARLYRVPLVILIARRGYWASPIPGIPQLAALSECARWGGVALTLILFVIQWTCSLTQPHSL